MNNELYITANGSLVLDSWFIKKTEGKFHLGWTPLGVIWHLVELPINMVGIILTSPIQSLAMMNAAPLKKAALRLCRTVMHMTALLIPSLVRKTEEKDQVHVDAYQKVILYASLSEMQKGIKSPSRAASTGSASIQKDQALELQSYQLSIKGFEEKIAMLEGQLNCYEQKNQELGDALQQEIQKLDEQVSSCQQLMERLKGELKNSLQKNQALEDALKQERQRPASIIEPSVQTVLDENQEVKNRVADLLRRSGFTMERQT